MLDAGDFRRRIGPAAGGDQDMFRVYGLAGREPHRVGVSSTARVLTMCAPAFSTLVV